MLLQRFSLFVFDTSVGTLRPCSQHEVIFRISEAVISRHSTNLKVLDALRAFRRAVPHPCTCPRRISLPARWPDPIIPIVEAHVHDFTALIPALLANLAVAAVLFA